METFLGYRRPDGKAGVRNHVAIISTVSCANTVVQQIERAVPGVIGVTHEHGCSQVGADLQQTVDTLVGVGRNPNVFAVLVVSLGCEAISAPDLTQRIAASGKPTELITIQDVGGSTKAVEAGKKVVRRFLRQSRKVQAEAWPISELMVGLQCGGSDGWSGITANPALGQASDLLVAAGATAMLAETPELVGAEHLVARPGSAPQAVEQLLSAIASFENEVRRLGLDPRGAQPTPGNMAGGLTTIEEKSLGAMMKGGTTPLREFVRYAQPPTQHGLVMMDTPGNDVTSMSAQIAGGCQVLVFSTGRGSPTGTPIAPVIKISTNSGIFKRMRDNIDMDAGTIISEGESLPSVGRRIYDEILAVANGKQTRAEILGHREFAICRIALTF
jgi:altronate dehydratase large subunit